MGTILCKTDQVTRMEQEREEGQALLRSMVLSSTEVDWAAVIAKANELHRKEQAYLNSKNKRQRKLLDKLQKRALIKRKRQDSIGSFSVNMLTFRANDNSNKGNKSSTFSASGSTTHDDHSYDNGSYGSGLSASDGWGMARSYDDGTMEPIDEEIEAVYSVP